MRISPLALKFIFFCIVVIALLAFKLPLDINLSSLLWAEDGAIFTSQALNDGWSSILITYQGYLHLLPRLIALAAVEVDLGLLPKIYLIAWFVFVFYAIYLIYTNILAYIGNAYWVVVFIGIILLQPSNNEIYYTITNIQWFFALALAVYVLLNNQTNKRYIFIPVATLTGPFSVFLMPFVILKTIFQQNKKEFILNNSLYFMGAVVQLIVMLSMDRDRKIPTTEETLNSLWTFFSFGYTSEPFAKVIFIINVITLILVVYLIVVQFVKADFKLKNKLVNLSICLGFALSLFLASLLALDGYAISPDGMAGRYFFIPYSILILVCLAVLKGFKPIVFYGYFAFLLLIFIPKLNGQPLNALQGRAEVFFSSYERLRFIEDLTPIEVDINPIGWQDWTRPMLLPFAGRTIEYLSFKLGKEHVKLSNGDVHYSSDKIKLKEANGDPFIIFMENTKCLNFAHQALLVKVEVMNDSVFDFYWAPKGHGLSETLKQTKVVKKGSNKIVFAVPTNGKLLTLRIDPTQHAQEIVKISDLALYCYN